MHTMPTRAASLPIEGHAALSRRRHDLAQFATADAGGLARQGRARRLLDLHLHQLAAHATLRSCVGREVQGSGTRGDRRAHARVRVREERRQHSPGAQEVRYRVSGRRRQRLRDMGCIRQSLLARRVCRRRERQDPPSPVRRRRVRAHGSGHSATSAGRRIFRQRATMPSRSTRAAPKLPRTGTICDRRRATSVATKRRASCLPAARSWARVTQLRCPAIADAQPMGAQRRLDGERRRRRARQAQRTHRLPVSRARPAPGHGTVIARIVGALPGAPRRSPARQRARHRRRRAGRTAPSRSTGSISSSGSPGPSRIDCSRSSSSTPA